MGSYLNSKTNEWGLAYDVGFYYSCTYCNILFTKYFNNSDVYELKKSYTGTIDFGIDIYCNNNNNNFKSTALTGQIYNQCKLALQNPIFKQVI